VRDITEEKRAREALEFQKYALDQASIVAITDVKGTITYVNDTFCQISGYSREELLGQNHRILNSGLHPKEFFRDMYATIVRGQVWRGEIRNRRKDGSFYWVDTTIVPFMGPHGTPESYIAIRTDITERKRNAAQLEFQKYALDQASIVAITDVKGTITYVNDTFCQISGYSREELLGQNHRILNSGLHPTEFFRDMYATIVRGQVWRGEIRNRRKDGSYYWVDTTIVPSVGPHGKPESYVAIRTDITERKRNAAQLEFQKYALDQAAIVAITDVKGTITYVNDTFCQISGYSREELLGQNHRLLNSGLHPKEFFRDMYATIVRGQVWRGEIRNRRKDGSYYWVDTTIVPSMGPHGKPESYVAIRTDITERKRNEEALRNANADLLQFASAASHDLKEPLRGVSRLATFIRDDQPDLTPESRERLERMRALCERLTIMVSGLLEHARTGLEPRLEPCDLNTVVRHVVDTSAEELAARGCEVIIGGTLPILLADRVLIERVFANLISNAVKFNDSVPRRVEIFWDDHAGAVAVRDNGIGIDPRHHDSAFRIFKRVHSPDKYSGVGLGLALARKIIEAHGGQIELESALGVGSTFRLRLPVVQPGRPGLNGEMAVLVSPAPARIAAPGKNVSSRGHAASDSGRQGS
jgi:PAS domain S-box-containing protein